MKIAFRVNASLDIGLGHFVRCIALAEVFREIGLGVTFITSVLPSHLKKIISSYEINHLEITHIRDAGTELEDGNLSRFKNYDADKTNKILKNLNCEWLIVDGYGFDEEWESRVAASVKNILVIDDLANRRHSCTILVDQNLYQGFKFRYKDLVDTSTLLALGPKYAILRKSFTLQRMKKTRRKKSQKKVLIFFGGTDPSGYTYKLLCELGGLETQGYSFEVVIGKACPFLNQVTLFCIENNITLHIESSKMEEIIYGADLAVGSSGSVLWEYCCLGTPSIVMPVAENQVELAQALSKFRVAIVVNSIEEMVEKISLFLESGYSKKNLNKISKKGKKIVDGLGVLRILSLMQIQFVTCRLATLDDSLNIFKWRNTKLIRSISKNKNTIKRDEHQIWFASAINDKNTLLLIGVAIGIEIGVVRFNIIDNCALISIYLAPKYIGLVVGLGSQMLKSSELLLINNYPNIKTISAEVESDNTRSQNLFINNGYKKNTLNMYTKAINHA